MDNNYLFCASCGKEVPYSDKILKETLDVCGDEIVVDAVVSHCDYCGNELYNEKNDSETLMKSYNIYRSMHSLLYPYEIMNIRNKYGLSQSVFARALGLDEKAIKRYEQGCLQTRVNNNLIVLADNPDVFREIAVLNKDFLSVDEFESITAAIDKFCEDK